MTQTFKTMAFLAIGAMAGAGFIRADDWDKQTTIEINEPMRLPNVVLQPGSYVFRLMNSPYSRHIVQVYDKSQTHLITTILAIPNERVEPTGKSVFAFWEVPAGQPKALRAWFYPGDNFGQEFAYPKGEAATLTANNPGAAVPTTEQSPSELASSVPSKNTQPAPAPANSNTQPQQQAEARPAPAPAPEPAPAVTTPQQNNPGPEVAQANPQPRVTPPQDNSQPAPASQPQQLPKTASEAPLLALLGLLSIAGAFTVHFAFRRG